MKINKKEIGKRLKDLRKSKNLTQQELANIFSLAGSGTINNWEKGKSKPKDTKEQPFLTRYSEFFDVSKDWILYGSLNEYIQDILSENNINIYSDEVNHFILTCISKYSKLPPKIANKLLYLSSEELESEELSKQYIDYPSESSILHDYNKFIHDTSLKINKNKLGNRLASIRKANNLSQEEIAEIIGVNGKSTIANWENNRSKPRSTKNENYLKKYSEIFDVDLNWILYGDFERWVEEILIITKDKLIIRNEFFKYLKKNNLYEVYDKDKILNAWYRYIPEQLNIDKRFTKVDNVILDDYTLNGTAKLTYINLCRFADNKTGEFCLSNKILAEVTRCSVRSIQRSLKSLIEKGYITKNQRNKYCIKKNGGYY